jgi:hypothetical protein
VEANASDKLSFYNGDNMSSTITFVDGSIIEFENIEKVTGSRNRRLSPLHCLPRH